MFFSLLHDLKKITVVLLILHCPRRRVLPLGGVGVRNEAGEAHIPEDRFQAMTSSTALASARNTLRGWNGKRTGILIKFTLTPKNRSVNHINISARMAKKE